VGPQVLALGLIFVLLGLVTDGLYAVGAGGIGGWLRARRGVLSAQRWVVGTMYIGLGLAAALSGEGKK
jgi:threonine/homoserine/homoserine lactone efflux protein